MHIKTKATHHALIAGLLAASAAVTGCGGSKSVADKAQDICKQYNAKINALPQPKALSEIKTYIDTAAPLADEGTAKLAALKPPSDKKAQWEAWIATLNQEGAVIHQARSAADSGNIAQAVTLVKQQQPLSSRGNAEAKALGLKECTK